MYIKKEGDILKKNKKEENDGQFLLEGFSLEEKKTINPVKLTEIYQKKKGEEGLSQQNLPEDIKKNRSQLISEIVSTPPQDNKLDFVQQECSELTDLPVNTKVQVLYEKAEGLDIEFQGTLTNFDREVIDAVATLAPTMDTISSSTIYRIITGKSADFNVGAAQRKKIDDSMLRCARCLVNIDLTEAFLSQYPSETKNTKSFQFRGQLITYKSFIHKAHNGGNIYYQLFEMPPIFKYAELLGKVSQFPLHLLDTPVAKTDNIISLQSYLLRTIDEMKKKEDESFIPWQDVYDIAEIDTSVKQYTANIRKNVKKMLDYWLEKSFIFDYVITTKKYGGISLILKKLGT